jgi:four helix bundle protein
MDEDAGFTDLNLLHEPLGKIDNFKDLICWQKCRELRIIIESLVKSFPISEKNRLSDQLVRAARSTTNNIAEGFGRYHFKDSIRFYYITRGSISEIIDHLIIALDNHYISQSDFDLLETKCHETSRILNSYIKFIQSKTTIK